MIGIGNAVGWTAAIYVKDALPGLIGHVVVSTIGAFVAGYLSLALFPAAAQLGMTLFGIAGAALLLYVTRLRKLRRNRAGSA